MALGKIEYVSFFPILMVAFSLAHIGSSIYLISSSNGSTVKLFLGKTILYAGFFIQLRLIAYFLEFAANLFEDDFKGAFMEGFPFIFFVAIICSYLIPFLLILTFSQKQPKIWARYLRALKGKSA